MLREREKGVQMEDGGKALRFYGEKKVAAGGWVDGGRIQALITLL